MNSYYRRYQENTFLLNICKTVMDIVMVVLAAYVIVSFACTRTTISGGSMEDTIKMKILYLSTGSHMPLAVLSVLTV